MLLGFKFNVSTLIPVVFGILALLAKKAIIVSKIALVISSALGLGTLLLGNQQHAPGYAQHYPGHFGQHHAGAHGPGYYK